MTTKLNKCTNCDNINECEKSCILHTGKALVDYITRIDTIQTRIGEYSSTKVGGKVDLIVSGHKIFDMRESPCWLLSSIDTTLGMSDKFKNAFNKSANQLVTLYCKSVNMSKEETDEVLNKLRDINKNKQLILPLKPKTDCIVDIDTEDCQEKSVKGKINFIKWATDKETYKLRCTVNLSFDDWHKSVNYSLAEYINKFTITSLEFKSRGDKHDASMISMTEHGIIKPIVVKDKSTKIIIDGTYLYLELNNEIVIIGYWDEKNELIITKKVKSKALDKIKNNLDYIKDHKKYIAPYLVYEPNIIEV